MASYNPESLTKRLPENFGRYTLLGRIAVGGMAEVFVARCGELMGMQALIAVKRILPVHAADAKFVQMFQREASIALRLSHRSIARVFEVGCVDNQWFLSMELVQGENLARVSDALDERGLRWDPSLVAFIGAEAARALEYAHNLVDARGRPLNIVHRDLSPENIMIGFDGSAKVIDFGIAMCESYASLTTQGAVRGKVQYVSPEQAQTQKLDRRSDLFSLGVVLYECLAGQHPFERDGPMETLDAVVHDEAPAIPNISPALNQVLTKALQKDPNDRYQTCEAFGNALLQAISGEDAGPNKVAQLVTSLFPRKRNRWNEIQSMAFEGFGFADRTQKELPAVVPTPVEDDAVLDVREDAGAPTDVQPYYQNPEIDRPERRTLAIKPPVAVPPPRRRALKFALGGVVAAIGTAIGFGLRKPSPQPATPIATTEPVVVPRSQDTPAPRTAPEPIEPATLAEATPEPSEEPAPDPTPDSAIEVKITPSRKRPRKSSLEQLRARARKAAARKRQVSARNKAK
jgi:eukaryotic-like serine/threonine-protein kinase